MNIYLLYKAICATGKCSFLFGGFSDSSVKLLNHVRLCDPVDCSTPGFLSITNSQSLIKLMSIESVMPSNHVILCCPLLLLPSIFPNIRVFSNESVLSIRWPKYWSFIFSISPSNKYLGLISFRIDLQSKGFSRVLSNTRVQKHTNSLAISPLHGPILISIHDYGKNHSFD